MVKGSDFVYEPYSEDEEEDDSNEDSRFEYSDDEGEVRGSEGWKERRRIARRKVVIDEDGHPNLIMNRAERKEVEQALAAYPNYQTSRKEDWICSDKEEAGNNVGQGGVLQHY
ncbi:hypothetical protein PIB30_027448 [Stylosanthes scabra]|uniref:Uncharacterized protein n=1 Tax=Stylosanthes scabra TaxID=79078 RepID=A0ABU6Y989_9FABA|nr:hypothetical protein [Stylosanthes scabra]